MPNLKPDRKRVDVGSTELRQRIAHYLNCAAFDGNRVVISRQGHMDPIAVLISYDEFSKLTGKKSATAAAA